MAGTNKGAYKIIEGDCLEVMKTFEDNQFDLVLTSPPYNMNLRIRGGQYTSRQLVKEISTKYIGYDDNLPMDKYFEFNNNVLRELLRVSPLVFYNVQFLTGNKVALFKLIGFYAEQLKEIIVWDKMMAEPAIGEGILNSRFEVILVFDKNNAISRKFNDANFSRGTLQNLWQIPKGEKQDANHGAIFPKALATKIITNFTQQDDTILDPFAGTGTTLRAAKDLNRKCTVIEINPDYIEIINKRERQEVLL